MKKLIFTFILLAILVSPLFAQKKEVLVIFEVELKGLTPKPIQEGVLTDAITAELAEAGFYNLVDRDTQYYYFKQIQEKSHKPCEGPECLADLAANLDADLFVKAEVSKVGAECAFSAKLYKRKPNTVLYFVDQTKIESCLCQAGDLQKTAHILGKKIAGREEGQAGKSPEVQGAKPADPGGDKETEVSGKKDEPVPMVLIPAGEFMMGCNSSMDNQCASDEKPYHRAYLDKYYIDKYEVTNAEYRRCVAAGSCKELKWTDRYRDLSWDNHPVVGVNWFHADNYCGWAGKRLPTEAEWEKAARGKDGRLYPWGGETATCDYAVIYQYLGRKFIFSKYSYGCDRSSNWPVGSKPDGASPYGLMDMAGNVGEWVNDWHGGDYYRNSPAQNPSGPASGKYRVWRGGSWYSDSYAARASSRFKGKPAYISEDLGFRCARDAK
jgi:formylglycine-generating enzyme required for sulfatase activity